MPSERVDELLDTLGDERSRAVLAAVNDEPRSAKELACALDASLPTVYRRLDDLQDAGLITAHTAVAADGNHYQRYSCTFEELSVRLDDDSYVVEVEWRTDPAERFADLWDALSDR